MSVQGQSEAEPQQPFEAFAVVREPTCEVRDEQDMLFTVRSADKI